MPRSSRLPLWLLCATMLTSTPAFAETKPSAATDATAAIASLTPDDAIARALAQSPRLQALDSGVAAARGELRQSGTWTNPELGIEAENIAGKGDYRGFDSAEMTYGVTQELPISGKLTALESIAGKGLEIASLDYQSAALDVIRDVSIAYAEAIAAEENVQLADEQKTLAEDVLKSVSLRVGAAAAPLIQKSRAEVERSTASIALDTAMRERDMARKRLATLMGDEQLLPALDSAAFYRVDKPDTGNAEDKLTSNPDLLKLASGYEQSKARLDFEQAAALPDPRVSVGMRDFRDSGDQAFVVGLSLPIPVLNGNRGNIEKARHTVNQTEWDNRQTNLTAQAELSRAEQQMENAYLRADTLKSEVLPAADKAFQLAREGYGLGRFPYLEVLDAQRSLFVARQQHIAALSEFHTAKAQAERLTAAHLNQVPAKGASHAE